MSGIDLIALLASRRSAAEESRERIEQALAALRADRSDGTADDEHDPEGATLSVEWSRLEGLRREALAELAALDAAQGRVDAGTYGVCVACGGVIPEGRLEALPFAMRCVECAS